MKLVYIYHSGFMLPCAQCTLVFDFWQDFAQVEQEILQQQKPLYVFCSHAHPDHFNPRVLQWKQMRQDVHYIFSSDILRTRKVKPDDATFLHRYETYEDTCLHVRTFGSTDRGVSFAVEVDGKSIFHAGDLNNWHWSDESTPQEIHKADGDFLHELRLVAEAYPQLDVAMFPIDARLGTDYYRGAAQFVKAVAVHTFVPMHFGDNYDTASAFAPVAEAAGCRFWSIAHCGESLDLDR